VAHGTGEKCVAGRAYPPAYPATRIPDQPVRRTGLIRRPCMPLAWGAAPRAWAGAGTLPARPPRRVARLGLLSLELVSSCPDAGAVGSGVSAGDVVDG
jgi:hypothetical protein